MASSLIKRSPRGTRAVPGVGTAHGKGEFPMECTTAHGNKHGWSGRLVTAQNSPWHPRAEECHPEPPNATLRPALAKCQARAVRRGIHSAEGAKGAAQCWKVILLFATPSNVLRAAVETATELNHILER